MDKLSFEVEQLLKDIILHRNEYGVCDLKYWADRFAKLESNESHEVLVRNRFGILKDNGMIAVQWGDDVPYKLHVLEKGIAYYEQKLKEKVQHMQGVSIFVSYNQKTGEGFVTELEKRLNGRIRHYYG